MWWALHSYKDISSSFSCKLFKLHVRGGGTTSPQNPSRIGGDSCPHLRSSDLPSQNHVWTQRSPGSELQAIEPRQKRPDACICRGSQTTESRIRLTLQGKVRCKIWRAQGQLIARNNSSIKKMTQNRLLHGRSMISMTSTSIMIVPL